MVELDLYLLKIYKIFTPQIDVQGTRTGPVF